MYLTPKCVFEPTPPTHHADSVVEQGLAKQDDVEDFVDVDLLKDSEDGHGVDGRQEGREHQAVQELEGPDGREEAGQGTAPDRQPNHEGVVDGRDEGKQQDRAQVVEERPIGHEVARVEDDGREEVEEEGLCVEGVPLHLADVEDHAQDHAQDDEEAALGEDGRQAVVQVKSCVGEKW